MPSMPSTRAALMMTTLIVAASCRSADGVKSEPVVSTTPSAAATATAAATSQATSPLPGTAASAVPVAAIALPNMRRCLGECVQNNQMRAVSADQIERDCRATCRSRCLEHCKAHGGDEPNSMGDKCRADCQAQADDAPLGKPSR
jgi:hypothetical protein